MACPYCNQSLDNISEGLHCSQCELSFTSNSDAIDFRLSKPKYVNVEHKLDGNDNNPEHQVEYGFLTKKATNADFQASDLPVHISPEMATHYPLPQSEKAICLDLGCGHGGYKRFIEQLGYVWCGVDYSRKGAPIFADAHALPFMSNSFELISSLAVLEHLKFPDVALREAFRILQPGGTFIGSVTYLVPFHDTASYFNMTHCGLETALSDAGFEVSVIGGDKVYLGIRALAYSGMFLGLNRKVAYALVEPLVFLQKLWWAYKRRKRPRYSLENECLYNTGAYVFVATKPQ